MTTSKPTIGIIGYGSFGSFLARQLDAYADVKVSSRRDVPQSWKASFEEVAQCDWLIPAIPLNAYGTTLDKLADCIGPETVIVDVCSVKELPIELIQSALPDQKLVATHPMFGPESAEDSLKDHVIILCPEASDPTAYKDVAAFSKKLELRVEEMSAFQHDELLAKLHGLTFFVARALDKMGVGELPIMTPSYRKLVQLAQLEHHHSNDLFHTIQEGNRQTAAVRQEFLDTIQDLEEDIKDSPK